MELRTTSQRFYDRWLFEMPQRVGKSHQNPYQELIMGKDANESLGYEVEALGNNLFRLSLGSTYAYYWHEKNGHIDIIAGLKPFEHGWMIEDVGKDGNGMYASEFYIAIKNHIPGHLLFSGATISDEGYKIWQWLTKSNAKLFGYDTGHPNVYTNIDSEEDLENFSGPEAYRQNQRFVLSENAKERCGTVWNSFHTWRIYCLVHNSSFVPKPSDHWIY